MWLVTIIIISYSRPTLCLIYSLSLIVFQSEGVDISPAPDIPRYVLQLQSLKPFTAIYVSPPPVANEETM